MITFTIFFCSMLSSLDSHNTIYHPLTPRSISIALNRTINQLPTHSRYYLTYYNIFITITFHFTYSKRFVCNVLTPIYLRHTHNTQTFRIRYSGLKYVPKTTRIKFDWFWFWLFRKLFYLTFNHVNLLSDTCLSVFCMYLKRIKRIIEVKKCFRPTVTYLVHIFVYV